MPRDILDIASAMKKLYISIFELPEEENDLTEMKMHKLLYFAQKRHFSHFGEWLFDDDFVGWVHGPVNKRVRSNFMFLDESHIELTPKEEFTIREVIHDYGKYSARALRDFSHKDKSYKKARQGLQHDELGNNIMLKEDIIEDIQMYE